MRAIAGLLLRTGGRPLQGAPEWMDEGRYALKLLGVRPVIEPCSRTSKPVQFFWRRSTTPIYSREVRMTLPRRSITQRNARVRCPIRLSARTIGREHAGSGRRRAWGESRKDQHGEPLSPHVYKVDPKTGRRRQLKARRWYGQYRDHDGILRRVPLCNDKTATASMLNELVRTADRRRSEPIDASRTTPSGPWLTT